MRLFVLVTISFSLILLGCTNSTNNATRDDLDDSLLIAEDYYAHGAYDSAVYVLNAIIARDSLNAKAYYRKAFCLTDLNDIENSNKNYLRAIYLNYKVDTCYNNIGLNFLILRDTISALENFQKAVDVNPGNQNALFFYNMFKHRKNSI